MLERLLIKSKLSGLNFADANDDGMVDISDPVNILLYLFRGEHPILPPYPDAGWDLSADGLKC